MSRSTGGCVGCVLCWRSWRHLCFSSPILWGGLLNSYIHKAVVQSWKIQEKVVQPSMYTVYSPLTTKTLKGHSQQAANDHVGKSSKKTLMQQAICSSVNNQKWEMNLEGMTFLITIETGVKRSHDGYLFTTLLCFSLNNFMCRIAMTWAACSTLGDNWAKKLKWDDQIMGKKLIYALCWNSKFECSALWDT